MGFPHMCSGLAAAILIKTVIMKMQIKSFVDCCSQTLLNQTENTVFNHRGTLGQGQKVSGPLGHSSLAKTWLGPASSLGSPQTRVIRSHQVTSGEDNKQDNNKQEDTSGGEHPNNVTLSLPFHALAKLITVFINIIFVYLSAQGHK